MQTITIDIINTNAMQLLHDLELLKLIKVRKENGLKDSQRTKWDNTFKGAMSKQPINELNKQLAEIRNEWE
jgi:hypothetical protein